MGKAHKDKDWVGKLVVALKVNDTFVGCDVTDETESQKDMFGNPNAEADVYSYSLDNEDVWDGDWYCRTQVWSY